MTQMSRNELNKDVYYEIRDDLLSIVSQLTSKEKVKLFYYEFFTKTERLMFAKRMGIVMMIRRGYNYDEIQAVLKVSTSTITSVSRRLDQGSVFMKHLVDKMVQDEKTEFFWDRVDKFIEQYLLKPRLIHSP